MLNPISKIKGYAMIFDANKMPVISFPKEVPQEVWDRLTPEQQLHANNNVNESLRRK